MSQPFSCQCMPPRVCEMLYRRKLHSLWTVFNYGSSTNHHSICIHWRRLISLCGAHASMCSCRCATHAILHTEVPLCKEWKTCSDRKSCTLPECWQSQLNCSVTNNDIAHHMIWYLIQYSLTSFYRTDVSRNGHENIDQMGYCVFDSSRRQQLSALNTEKTSSRPLQCGVLLLGMVHSGIFHREHYLEAYPLHCLLAPNLLHKALNSNTKTYIFDINLCWIYKQGCCMKSDVWLLKNPYVQVVFYYPCTFIVVHRHDK